MSKKLLVSISTPLLLLLVLLLGFQNCSKKGDNSFSEAEVLSFDSDSPEIKNVTEGTNLVLEIPKKLIDDKFPGISFTCKWAYKGTDGQVLELDVTDDSLNLDNAQVAETGRYRVVCTGGDIQVIVIFVVIINPYVPPTEDKGLLTIKLFDKSITTNEELTNQTRESAVTKCSDRAKANPSKGVVCTWKTEVIFKRDLPAEKLAVYKFVSHIDDVKAGTTVADVTKQAAETKCTADVAALVKKSSLAGYECFWDGVSFKKKEQEYKKDIYRGYFLVGSKKEQFIETKNITRADALKNCKLNADNNPKKSVVCTWGSDTIYSRIVEDPKKNTYKGYFIEKGKTRLFITTKNITRADALKNCELNSKNNPKLGILCVWGEETILKKAEPSSTGVYTGYFIENGKERQFIKTAKITRADALANCKLNHKNNAKYGIRCTWEKETIFSAAEPVAKKIYKGYFISGGKEQLFITTKDITRADALANCKLNNKNNPAKGIRCTWGEETILKVAEPVIKKTYIGYFVNKGKKTVFILTEKIERAEALKNCKLNATNNPKKSVSCVWGGELIFENILAADK